jgi:Flp pilus assembly protein TadG
VIIKDQNGAALVEFAIVLPMLILVLFGTIEFGLILFNQNVITNASREGARAGIVVRSDRFMTGDPVNVSTKVNDWLSNNLVTFGGTGVPQIYVEILDATTNNFAQFNTITPEANRSTGFQDPLKVRVTYDYHFLVLSSLGFGPITIKAEALMQME